MDCGDMSGHNAALKSFGDLLPISQTLVMWTSSKFEANSDCILHNHKFCTIECAPNPSNDKASIRQTKDRIESSNLYSKYCHPFGKYPLFAHVSIHAVRHFKVYGPSMSKQKRNIVQVDSTLTETNLSSWWIQQKNENIPSASSRSERELFIKSVLGYNLHIKH